MLIYNSTLYVEYLHVQAFPKIHYNSLCQIVLLCLCVLKPETWGSPYFKDILAKTFFYVGKHCVELLSKKRVSTTLASVPKSGWQKKLQKVSQMGQFPQDGGNGQNVAFFWFSAVIKRFDFFNFSQLFWRDFACWILNVFSFWSASINKSSSSPSSPM